jgi:hypothetical protein
MTFARILGITVATAVIVFLGLTFFSPKHHEEKAQSAGVTPDQVFAAAATPPAPGETPAAAPAEAANPAAPAASAPAAAADSSAPASSQQGLSDEEARKIAEDVGRKVATRVVEEKSASSAPASDASPSAPSDSAPAPATAIAEPASSTDSTPVLTERDVRRIAAEEARRVYAEGGGASHGRKAMAKPAAEETVPAVETASATAPEPAPAPAEKPATHSGKTKKSGTRSMAGKDMAGDLPATDAITAWWLTTDKQPPDHLNLVYAGSAASEKSAVLLFSDPVDAAAASSHLQLFSADGKPVSGSWEASPGNPRMLLFKSLAPGRYTVVIAPETTSSAGKTMISGLHGPIYIR